MSYELFVSIRHLSAKKSQKFISLNTWISIAGVGLGVMALIVVIAVMSGFSKDLRDKILGTNSHIVVSNMNQAMVENYNDILKKIRSMKGVTAAAPFIMNQVMLINGDRVSGVVARGIDPDSEGVVSDLGKNMISGTVFDLKVKPNHFKKKKKSAGEKKSWNNFGEGTFASNGRRSRRYCVYGFSCFTGDTCWAYPKNETI
jgi:lipoprotein-releasing system permease protein